MSKAIVLGADIGGSHITTALIDQEQGTLLPGSWHRERVNSGAGADEIIHSWGRVMKRSLEAAPGVYRVGIAMPGPFDYDAGVSFIRGLHKYDSLYGLNVKDLLADQLHTEAQYIQMANDAQCFLQGELLSGAAKGYQDITGLTLGTGFGAAIAEGGIAREARYFEMHFLESTAEEYFCSRWFIQRYKELTGEQLANVKEIAADVQRTPDAMLIFHEFGSNLALFLSELRPVPKVVLLGGNIAHTYALFSPSLQDKLDACGLQITFVLSALDERATLFGAAGIA
ncbi:ROK family protein [uncultured Chitinophaga sp.]|jgi:Transcriptional regulator/sugar kinase|uniref:ROK family protein n=1 Tax=uncultured Chitinophaga sp. TaxID=339340 RepID=UPI002612842C|nr:ROK family protein [uncultured Chitinophaga sp.]